MSFRINKILLADDDRDHGLLFKKIIEQKYPSCMLSHVDDGNKLLQSLASETYDLLFLDLNMPCKNGIECLQYIRKKLKLKDLPVIMYSSSSQLPDIVLSYANKANLYMVKPFTAEQLGHAVESLFLNIDWVTNASDHKYYFMNNKFVPYTAAV